MKFFLCRFTRIEKSYPDSRREIPDRFRIVIAKDESAARLKLLEHETRGDPYGFSVDIDDIEIDEAIE